MNALIGRVERRDWAKLAFDYMVGNSMLTEDAVCAMANDDVVDCGFTITF